MSASSLLDNLPAHIWVADRAATEAKVAKVLQDGRDHLHVISDFDMTMTKFWVNGQRGLIATSNALYNTYYPIESSLDLTLEQKVPKMREWWTKSHEVIVKLGLKRQDIAFMVKETPMTWRANVDQVLRVSEEKGIPVMVFSAGIKDIIQEILQSSGLLRPHMHVVSNELTYTDDAITGFKDPLIHVFNKSEVIIDPTSAHFQAIKGRENVLLMGDSPGDIHMADGLQHGCCLKVGFLNHDEEAWRAEFTSKFDVVITGDQGMDWVVQLLQLLK
ncbi:hypothetical protein RI367_004014 [Sorochytrium milnesiophthora]